MCLLPGMCAELRHVVLGHLGENNPTITSMHKAPAEVPSIQRKYLSFGTIQSYYGTCDHPRRKHILNLYDLSLMHVMTG